MISSLLHPSLVAEQVRSALSEDFGLLGDITSQALIDEQARSRAVIVTRRPGAIAGLPLAEAAFLELDPGARFESHVSDGQQVGAGAELATVEGLTRAILGAERVALNFLGHLSGIASATAHIVRQVAGLPVRVVCTRKTTPGLRHLEKYAVRMGGAFNHRATLSDAVLIKDNHLRAVGGVREAVVRAKAVSGHTVKIEVEVETVAELAEALEAGADIVMLDNFTLPAMREAVTLAKGKTILEASGNVTAETIRAIAETGVDYISVGWITHSAPTLDVSLEFS